MNHDVQCSVSWHLVCVKMVAVSVAGGVAVMVAVVVVCVADQLDDVDNSDTVVYYVLLRAVDRFHSQMNRYPGLYDEHVELDIPVVKVSRGLITIIIIIVSSSSICVCRLLVEFSVVNGPVIHTPIIIIIINNTTIYKAP